MPQTCPVRSLDVRWRRHRGGVGEILGARDHADGAAGLGLAGKLAAAGLGFSDRREQFAAASGRTDWAEAGRDGERARVDALADRVHVLQADLAAAQAEAEWAPPRARKPGTGKRRSSGRCRAPSPVAEW
jgi:hypothetical protein